VGQSLLLSVISVDLATQNYMDALTVEIPNKDVSVINLTLTETLPGKGEVIVNRLLTNYLSASINTKTRVADSTLRFIDERLRLVFGELSGIERNIQQFKTDNKFTDLNTQANLLLQNTSEYSKQQTGQEIQLSVVEALEQFLKDNQNDLRVVPSSLVMQDAGFIALVQRYNEMQLQRDKLLMSVTPEHPSIKTIDEQLRNLRTELVSSIASVKKGLQVGVDELKKRTAGFEGEFNKVPGKERAFLDISRQQSIKQELYLFLLKKREETAVSRSSTTASARIIDLGKSEPFAAKPKKMIILLVGLLAGVAIPFGISFGRDFLNTRVASIEDINAITHTPVLAEIGHSTEGNVIAVSLQSRQLAAEHLRGLRTNLQYLLTGKDEKTILITSSMSGEGKSFLSINLCITLALAGKKVILVELDLRKPKVSENLGLAKDGFTNYIIASESDWKKWVKPSGVQENFDVMSSGMLPPNPTELLMSPKTALLFKELKKQYDYVIIDTPPAGLVTDAEIVAPLADTTFYVVRQKHTYKQQLLTIEKFVRKAVLPRLNIILNDVAPPRKTYGRPYDYGYGYGYGPAGANKKRRRTFINIEKLPELFKRIQLRKNKPVT
jgi:capsular exopolysaccharide synthesis family protein